MKWIPLVAAIFVGVLANAVANQVPQEPPTTEHSQQIKANDKGMLSPILGGIITALVGAGAGYALGRRTSRLIRVEQQLQAAAALRFELELNLAWLRNIPGSKLYLRDEAWVRMKNEGYMSYVKHPIPSKSVVLYEHIHILNYHLKVLGEAHEEDSKNPTEITETKKVVTELRETLTEDILYLMKVIDANYPNMHRNFGP